MDHEQRRAELSDFLRTRRAQLSPQQAGVSKKLRRRTPGLRREEVAELAGVSVDWYTYLEQGRDIHVSRRVLECIADALQLTTDERHHFSWLADQPLPSGAPPFTEVIQSVYQHILDSLGECPAYITGRRTDIVAWNRAATIVFGDFAVIPEGERNLLWLLFTETSFRQRFVNREAFAQETLSAFRTTVSYYLNDPDLTAFIDALKLASPEFQQEWAKHNVRGTCSEWRLVEHPQVGRLELELASFQVNGNPDLRCCVYSAVPGSETAIKLKGILDADHFSENPSENTGHTERNPGYKS